MWIFRNTPGEFMTKQRVVQSLAVVTTVKHVDLATATNFNPSAGSKPTVIIGRSVRAGSIPVLSASFSIWTPSVQDILATPVYASGEISAYPAVYAPSATGVFDCCEPNPRTIAAQTAFAFCPSTTFETCFHRAYLEDSELG